MTKKSLALSLLLSLAVQAHAASAPIHLTLGGAIKNSSRMNITPERSRIDVLVEGAGVITAQGKTVRFYALCNVIDTLDGTKQVEGAGDCELKSTAGGVAYLHYRGDAEHADRGRISIESGTGDFAGISGSVAVEASVNPTKVGKPVFLMEDQRDSASQP
ncbi:hypothetical protein LMG28688_00578 [Paraburkholderia caffeinitolerans]|uniref:Organic solvent tolerance-like N-terminal domain-containing protein n=1 Tax=Paraburkholderia caffeinitolerans TaxID=1723730 RepID=A0A6J5FEA1_9BURK|nr:MULTISPECIES: hypothetical protein [Paraburkholderia]CAB3778378.1 hypothetical protein LMG28688_00578 [Paraburkholderia caffeinitolerans]